jgi:hypothetical protein
MNNYTLLTLITVIFSFLSCSHQQSYNKKNDSDISREPQSVFTITKIEDHSAKNLKVIAKSNQVISLKYRLIKPINAGAAKSPAVASVELGAISAEQLMSDDKGFIYLNFTPSEKAGIAKVTIKAGKLQVVTQIEVLPPIDYGQLISSKHSTVEVSKTIAYANGNDIIEFKLKLKDHEQKDIPFNSQMLVQWELSDGVMIEKNGATFLFQVPKKPGTVSLQPKVENVNLIKTEIELKSTLNLQQINVLSNKQSQSQAELKLQFFDSFNQIIQNPIEVMDKILATKGQVSYKINGSILDVVLSFPTEKSASELTIYTTLGAHEKKFSFSFDNVMPDVAQSQVKIHPQTVVPNGFDPLEILLQLKTADQKVIDTIDPTQIQIKSQFNNHNVIRAKKLEDGKYHFVLSLKNVPEEKSEIQFFYRDQAISKIVEVEHNFLISNEKIKMEYYPEQMGFVEGFAVNKFSVKSFFDPNVELHKFVGFNITNEGINRIVPKGGSADADSSSEVQASREFQFNFREQAKQNMGIEIWEDTTGYTSRFMVSHFVIAPRKFIPYVEINQYGEIEITLPTGEKVLFDKNSKEILGGVLRERPIDMGPNRQTRTFADIQYVGKGIMIRANARGNSPQIGQFSQKVISGEFGNIGETDAMVYYYDENLKTSKRCILKKKDFWPAKDQNPIPFNFSNDEELANFLSKKCGEEFGKRARSLE